jgi:hypothetical protein
MDADRPAAVTTAPCPRPRGAQRFEWFLEERPELVASIHDPRQVGVDGRRLISVINEQRLRRLLAKMLDENDFLSPHGVRSVSRDHADHPFVLSLGGRVNRLADLPAVSDSGMFGGNANWRGPVWMPINRLIIRALLQYHPYCGDAFTVECPTGSGRQMNLRQVAKEVARRLTAIFLKDAQGRHPVYGGTRKFQEDPLWRDDLSFHEYFHGDNGAGLGAGHQTGWTGVIARIMHLFAAQAR